LSGDNAYSHPFGLVPRLQGLRVSRCDGVVELTSRILGPLDNTDLDVRREVGLDRPSPLLEVALSQHGHEGGNMGGIGQEKHFRPDVRAETGCTMTTCTPVVVHSTC